MPDNPKNRRSFSPAGRWRIALDQVLRTVLVLAVVVMLNFIGAQYFHRFYLSPQTNTALSSHTLAVLGTVTNQMTVTLYYDTKDQNNFYSTLLGLANEYHEANKRITVRTVDYNDDPAEAEKVKEQYNLPGAADSPNAPPAKDLIIFASAGQQPIVVPGEAIVRYKLLQIAPEDPHQKELEFRKKPVLFNGEVIFTSKLLALARAQPFKAYFLQGHGESSLSDDTTDNGYHSFSIALAQNDVLLSNLELLGDSDVPLDCNLLIIAGPTQALSPPELQKIDRYLTQGGRLFIMLNYASMQQPTGLEAILQHWGLNILPTYVKDTQSSINDQVVVVRKFNTGQDSFVNPLTQLALEMVLPRPIAPVTQPNPPANAPDVEGLAYSSDTSTLAGDVAVARASFPLIASVEQKPVAGVTNPRGNLRIVAAGDSMFLDNQIIETGANRDFLNYTINWLLDRQEILTGVNPRPVTEFRLMITQKENQQLEWLLLGALPGAVLVVGWLVWLVRRK